MTLRAEAAFSVQGMVLFFFLLGKYPGGGVTDKLLESSSSNSHAKSGANFARLYFLHFSTFRNQILQFYYF